MTGRAALFVALLSAACSPDDVTVALEQWSVDGTPTISIGSVDGDTAYLFQRVADADFLSDGRVVVADGGLSVLRVFDSEGRFVRQFGRRGEGPGEFLSVRGVWVAPPDTIGVWDPASNRVTYLDGDGTLLRTITLDLSGDAAGVGHLDFLVGALADGSVAIASLGLGDAGGLGADRVSVERFDATGQHLGRVGESTGFVRAQLGERLRGPLPFTPYPHFVTHGGAVYHTDGYQPTVTAWSASGERIIRFPVTPHDPAHAWSELEAEIRRRETALYLEALPTVPRPDSLPSLAGLLVDETGHVWAKKYDPSADALWLGGGARSFGGSWWVSDGEGTVVASVQMPRGFAPVRIRGTRALGIVVGEFGVERVEVRAISR